MSMQVKESNKESNIKQGSEVESFSEVARSASSSISAIESQIGLKEGGENSNVNIKKEKIIQFPQEVSIIVNDSDNANMNPESRLKSLSEKEPAVGLRLNEAEDDEKKSNHQKRVHDDNQDISLSEDSLAKSLNISSQLSQVDFQDGAETQDLQKQVD